MLKNKNTSPIAMLAVKNAVSLIMNEDDTFACISAAISLMTFMYIPTKYYYTHTRLDLLIKYILYIMYNLLLDEK